MHIPKFKIRLSSEGY